MTVFNRIDHAAGARSVGETLRPAILLIFGNPKVGTAFMKCGLMAGIDLPLKALVWEDGEGMAHISYNDPHYIAARHGITGCGDVLENMSKALNNFTAGAAGK